MRIIIGLGNPGKKYESTRHNAGFMAMDALAENLGLAWENNKKFKAEIAKNDNIILAKPLTFMNDSGTSAATILSYFKLMPENSDLSKILTVIHDDLDIEFGKYKISINSRSAGHKGVESIIGALKTKNFKRVRIGIKPEPAVKIPADKFVLQKFSGQEKNIIKKITPDMLLAVRDAKFINN